MEGIRYLFWCGLMCIILINQPSGAAVRYSPPKLLSPPLADIGPDPLFASSWHLDHIGAPAAWQITKGSRDVVIAVVDSGFDYNNPELANAIKRNSGDCDFNRIDDDLNGYVDDCIGYNFSEVGLLPWDNNGHGTFIAGIIAAGLNDKLGGAGVCPGCSIMPLRFLNSEGFGDTEDAIAAIEYAVQMGVSVINLSFNGEGYDQPLRNALKKALERDVVVVVAAGNEGSDNDKDEIYPANFQMANLLTVAASRRDTHLWKYSNFGLRKVHLAAPGTTIWGPWCDGKWYRSQATSFAAPMVAATAGLVRSANPELSAVQVVDIIKATVTIAAPLLGKVKFGGVVNAEAAVRCAVDPELNCLVKNKKIGRMN